MVNQYYQSINPLRSNYLNT